MTDRATHTAIILDTSGSMADIKEQAIDLFNEQRRQARRSAKKSPEIRHTMSLTLFGTLATAADREIGRASGVEVLHLGVPVADIPKINADTYRPQAMTPMYDGVGITLRRLKALDDGGEQTAFLVVVISDGLENNSREFGAAKIAKMIRKRQKTGRWTFVYLGAEHDLSDVKTALGLDAGNMAAFASTQAGTRAVSAIASAGAGAYYTARSAGQTATVSFVSDDDEITTVPEEHHD